MGKVFVEYKVFPEKRDAYLRFMRAMMARHPQLELYEGTDQPNLFVELWNDCGETQYAELKRERLHGEPDGSETGPRWTELAAYVPGGKDRIHMWHFREVIMDKTKENVR